MSTEVPVLKTLFTTLDDRLLKLWPLALAVTYFVGFIIVSLHLARYGASSLDLIKVQYLTAGIWFAGFVGFYFGIKASTRAYLADVTKDNGVPPRALTLALGASVIAALAWLVILALGSYLAQKFAWSVWTPTSEGNHSFWFWLGAAAPSVLGLGLFDVFLQISWSLAPTKDKKLSLLKRTFRWAGLVLSIAAAFLGISICVRAFSRILYAQISFSLGGGQPRQAVFCCLDAKDSTAASFLKRDGIKPYSVPYDLLLENQTSLVVISPEDNQRVIEFDRKSVEGIIIVGKQPPSSHQ